jgi:AcrR family transcriptional regulator
LIVETERMGRATVSGQPSSNKRDAILAAGIRCFAARGLAGSGMRDIARAAGLTEGTLYHYFSSKEALIEAAFGWSAFPASSVRDAMKRPDAPLRERLLAVGAEFLATLWRSPDWTRVVIREALRAPSEAPEGAVRAAVVSLAAERTRALAGALRDEMTAGRIRRCDPRRVAELLFSALMGHFVAQAAGRSTPAPRASADPFLVHLVDTIHAGLERPARRVAPAGGRSTGRGER